jgi:PAS domain S-box-containing protein
MSALTKTVAERQPSSIGDDENWVNRWRQPKGSRAWFLILSILASIALITGIVHATGGTRLVWTHFMYLPILLAATAFGIPGGLAAAFAGGLALGPYMPMNVEASIAQTPGNWLVRIAFFVLVGVLSGCVSMFLNHQIDQTKATKEQMACVLDHTKDVIFQIDLEGRYTYGNAASQRLTGYSLPQLLQMKMTDLLAPEYRPLMEERLRKKLANSAEEEAFECEIVHRDGHRIWTELVTANVFNQEQKLTAIMGVARDITQRKQAEASLQQSEERFRLIMENLADLVAVLDLDGRRVYNSPSYAPILGDPKQLAGSSSFDQVHPQDAARVKQAFQDTVRTARGQRLQYRLVDQHGNERHIESQGSVILDSAGKVSKVIVVSRDVTERHRSEEILRESETRYRFLFEHNPMPMFIYERGTFRMLAVNEAFVRHYGYSREEALALILTNLYPEDEKSKIAALAPALHGLMYVGEWHHRKRDGSFISVVVSSHDLAYDGREARLAVMSDVTERKRAEDEVRRLHGELQLYAEKLEQRVAERTVELAEARRNAEEANQLKSAFLATMSHELRTPLNSIIGFTGIILQGLAGPLNPEQTKQLEMVRGSARHLLALINDVLDISKIEAGKLDIRWEQVDLRKTMEKAAASVRPQVQQHGLSMTVNLAPNLGLIPGDAQRLEQILLNLLNNAIKFTGKGEVSLTAEIVPAANHATDPLLRVAVADTGIGIKPEDLGKLFQPFRQIDSGLSRRHEGTGLGLAICRRLAEMMGGHIQAASQWGKGSVFTLTLPVKGAAKT